MILLVTKLDKINKTTSKKPNKNDDNVMSGSCDVVANFRIYCQLGEIWKPDSGRIVCKTYIFVNSNHLSYQKWKQTKKSLT